MKKNQEQLLRSYIKESLEQNKKQRMNEGITNLVLDVVGFVPGIGEAADLLNALLYIKNEDYLSAAFSFISMVPEIGDIIGKGGKLAVWVGKVGGKSGAKAGKMVGEIGEQAIKVAKLAKQHIGKLKDALSKASSKFDAFKQDKKVQAAAEKMGINLDEVDLDKVQIKIMNAINEWIGQTLKGAPSGDQTTGSTPA
jgi:hypothetical protein